MTTKSNNMMAFTSVEDLTGTMEVIVFPKVLDAFRDVLKENAVVVIEGRLSVREDEAAKLMAETISPIENYNPKNPTGEPPRPYAGRGPAAVYPAAFPQLPAVREGDQSAGDF